MTPSLTLAPESRVAIDEYAYDPGKSQRQATVEVFRGMVHFLVSKILQTEKPDFIMKTHTGVLGVRRHRLVRPAHAPVHRHLQ